MLVSTLGVRAAVATAPTAATASPTVPLRIGQLNVQNLFPPGDDSGGEEPTPQEYATKLSKLALTITDTLGAPDIVAVEEVGNATSLDDLIAKTNLGGLGYEPVILESNDKRHINVGLLYRASSGLRFDGARSLNPEAPKGLPPAGGQVDGTRLFARPPLAVDFTVTGAAQAAAGAAMVQGGGKQAPAQAHHVELVVNHLMSKLGGTGEPRRNAQGAWLGAYVDEQRISDPKQGVIVLGDLNSNYGEAAYEAVAKHADGTPRMFDAPELKVKPGDRYTYMYKGDKNMLDHLLVTPDLKPSVAAVKIPHLNTDDWDPDLGRHKHQFDPKVPDGATDHDPIVATFDLGKRVVPA